MLAAMLSSFEETSRVFKDRGVCLGINTIRRVAQRYAIRAKIAQGIEQYPVSDTLGQRRVIISTDGGRIRIRKNKRGPRTKKNRRRYTTHWREPKLVMVYTVDVNGKMDRSFIPVIEGTLKGPDAVFGLLRYHLRQLNIGTADKILFVADGARWIWNRIPELIKSLGLSGSNVCELVDFYHAVEHDKRFMLNNNKQLEQGKSLSMTVLSKIPYNRLFTKPNISIYKKLKIQPFIILWNETFKTTSLKRKKIMMNLKSAI